MSYLHNLQGSDPLSAVDAARHDTGLRPRRNVPWRRAFHDNFAASSRPNA